MTPKRSGVPCQFTLEPEAKAILETLSPNRKSQGALISSLLRAEEQRRAEMRRVRVAVMQVFTEGSVVEEATRAVG
jgi:hypothetical protein